MATPTVPPRPSRASANAPSGPTAVIDNLPQIPTRPIRKMDPSPSRDMRSPFNELPNAIGAGVPKRPSLSNLTPDVPARPPSVSLPSVGQEGSEYASFDQLPPEAHGVVVDETAHPVEQTRNVSANMPLHAPRASVPQSTAKSRIETVTRTDSTQAAAAGIGRARPADDVHTAPADPSALSRVVTANDDLTRVPSNESHPLRARASWNRSTPSLHPTTSRPGSVHEGLYEHGIPEIGMQIPLNPNAGDAQAPSPAPLQSQFAPGIGFYNDGSRAHHRRRSSRKEFGPPGSFGMHGHGEEPSTQFEREWIRKHPEQAAVEGFNYHGPARPETAYTSAQLNRLVNQTNDVGVGADPDMVGTPGPDIAWGATQEYTSRMASPKPSPIPLSERTKRTSSGNQPPVASPLRKSSFPFNDGRGADDAVLLDDGSVIHVDFPERRISKVTGGGPADDTLDLGPRGGNTTEEGGWYEERGEGTPILASDEIMKRPGSAYMQPAVSPAEGHNDDYYESDEASRRNSLRIPSRPSSRPNSMHGEYMGGNLHRFISHDDHHGSGMHTPLEEIEEYEPLIPEEEELPKPKPKAAKRPRLEHHHFPSQDVWEDTPLSLQYSTTVETPEPPREAIAPPPPAEKSSTFETPEEEQQRREQNPSDMLSDSKALINKPHARALDDSRPGIQRFPSQDIWEDTPDSMRLVTTVSGPQMDEARSPPDDRPSTTGIEENSEDEMARATTGFTRDLRPSIPARPQQRKSKLAEEVKPEDVPKDPNQLSPSISPDKSQAPAIPDRPKPSIPARPARTSRGVVDSVEPGELTESLAADTPKSPPMVKAKPAIPARPGGEKIAALKSGFMNDLNQRLKLGPQAAAPKSRDLEPDVDEEAEKAPLPDARKSRARGPARRKPASSTSLSSSAADASASSFSFSNPFTTWHIDPASNTLQVPSLVLSPPIEDVLPALEKQMSLNESANLAEPPLTEPRSPENATSPPPVVVEAEDPAVAVGMAVTTEGAEAREVVSSPPPVEAVVSQEEGEEGKAGVVLPPPAEESVERASASAIEVAGDA